MAGRIIIDGEAFGYDGSYHYHNNYEETVYSRYMERVEKLIADHGLVVSGTSSDDMTYIKSFTIAAYNWLETPDIENINDLLYELREIAKEEQAFHEGHDYTFTFILEFYWIDKWNHNVQYISTIGNDGYQNNIFADCPDEDLDIRKLGMTQNYYSNVIPPVYNGVLIYVDYEDEEDLPVRDGTETPEDVSGGSTVPDDTTAPGGAVAPGSTDDTSGNASSVSG